MNFCIKAVTQPFWCCFLQAVRLGQQEPKKDVYSSHPQFSELGISEETKFISKKLVRKSKFNLNKVSGPKVP